MTGVLRTKLAECLTRERVIRLRSRDKRDALEELVDVLCADATAPLDPLEVLAAVWQREETLTTIVLPGVAIPHARVEALESTLVAVGISADGILWDSAETEPVRLMIMILGRGNDHLEVLSQIAVRLSSDRLGRDLLTAPSPRAVHDLLVGTCPDAITAAAPVMHDTSLVCFRHAVAMAGENGASTIILHADAVGQTDFLEHCRLAGRSVIVIARDISRYAPSNKVARFLAVPFRDLSRSRQMDLAFLFLVSQGILNRHEKVVSVCGIPGSGVLDTIMVTDLQREYRFFHPEEEDDNVHTDVEPQVLSRVLQVASSLAGEGREGKAVGTMFVVGDYDRVKDHCRQLVINPFRGYAADDLSILDPGLEETIKEFSRIDGAFVLRGNGVIMSAGTYLRTDAHVEQLPSGLGARHAAAAMVSRQTHALVVVLSESTRKLSLFRKGKRILEL